ncbi:hypothetical protein H696_00417 [Fonticula alba]|uniref:Uncharacterized protein n=1 Tax=Fonticula alba TaxID=691883 RepID=A0A058ZFW1_FONAL|nr:hypothetical protein H696_00417 [Fonticula alba]KCV72841.1 hypothetical protein H696_00417 [Fonticula alba]|eukprot:XP_009492542.1 hypothetical protein H696_00417 [Fonticula alba]
MGDAPPGPARTLCTLPPPLPAPRVRFRLDALAEDLHARACPGAMANGPPAVSWSLVFDRLGLDPEPAKDDEFLAPLPGSPSKGASRSGSRSHVASPTRGPNSRAAPGARESPSAKKIRPASAKATPRASSSSRMAMLATTAPPSERPTPVTMAMPGMVQGASGTPAASARLMGPAAVTANSPASRARATFGLGTSSPAAGPASTAGGSAPPPATKTMPPATAQSSGPPPPAVVMSPSKAAKPKAPRALRTPAVRESVSEAPQKTLPPAAQPAPPQAPQASVTQASRAPVAQASREALPQAPEAPVAQAPQAPVAQAPQAPMAQAPQAPMAQAPQAPMAQAPQAPMAQAPQAPMAQAPQAPMAQALQPLVAQAPQAPVPQVHQPPRTPGRPKAPTRQAARASPRQGVSDRTSQKPPASPVQASQVAAPRAARVPPLSAQPASLRRPAPRSSFIDIDCDVSSGESDSSDDGDFDIPNTQDRMFIDDRDSESASSPSSSPSQLGLRFLEAVSPLARGSRRRGPPAAGAFQLTGQSLWADRADAEADFDPDSQGTTQADSSLCDFIVSDEEDVEEIDLLGSSDEECHDDGDGDPAQPCGTGRGRGRGRGRSGRLVLGNSWDGPPGSEALAPVDRGRTNRRRRRQRLLANAEDLFAHIDDGDDLHHGPPRRRRVREALSQVTFSQF